MDVKSLIISKNDMENGKNGKIGKAKTDVQYMVELQNGCDFAISRKTSRSESLLVILMSQDQFYIKDMKTGEIKTLTVERLVKFMADVNDRIELDSVNWIDSLEKGKNAAEWIMKFLCPPYSSAAKQGILYVPSVNQSCGSILKRIHNIAFFAEYNYSLFAWITEFLQAYLSVGQKEVIKQMIISPDILNQIEAKNHHYRNNYKIISIIENLNTIKLIENVFGIEWVKVYVKMFMESNCQFVPHVQHLIRILYKNMEAEWRRDNPEYLKTNKDNAPDRIFEAESFIEYITYECCRQGKSYYTESFLQLWAQCLTVQQKCYGTIRDKYPEDLATACDKLESIRRLKEQNIDEVNWKKAAEAMKAYEWKPDHSEYQIISPKNPEDMYDEHMQLQNCISNYVQQVTYGACWIFFLRKSDSDETDKSIVTIEVLPGDVLGRIQAKNNREPNTEHMKFIKKWAEEKGISMH